MTDELQKLAAELDIEYVTTIDDSWYDTSLIDKIPFDWAKKNSVLPIKKDGKYYILTSSPEETQLLDHISMTINQSFEPIATETEIINMALEKAYFQKEDTPENFIDEMVDVDHEYISHNKTATDLLTNKIGAPVSQLVNLILLGAVKQKASDIHFEPFENRTRIRYRVDGVMYEQTAPPKSMESSLISRLKVMAHLDIAEKRQPQDGMAKVKVGKREIDMRVSTVPVAEGERIVLRLLDKTTAMTSLENLGMNSNVKKNFDKLLKQTNGIIIVSGPTGSGKTTSLYSFMNKVYSPEVKILTIEDPIEYHLAGISQTQVNRSKGYDFLSGLRAALRQDPDIVMVGEIRDSETASIAVNASLTGHLVLSTLHTNSAAGVIPRLIDLGVSPQILAAALSVSIAQRLVRKICKNCSKQSLPNQRQETLIRNILKEALKNNKPLADYGMNIDQKIMLSKGSGCSECNGTGYKGRIGLFEAIITDDTIEELLNKKPSEQDVRRVAEKQGLLNMREDGIIKILNGTTTLEEVEKVIDLEIKQLTTIKQSQDSSEKIIDHTNINPQALFTNKSIEISLLIDYLRSLEHQQMINPDHDVSHQINKVQSTILDLLKHTNAEAIFNQSNNFADTHKKFTRIADDLSNMHTQQMQNPNIDMSEKIRRVREEIEQHST